MHQSTERHEREQQEAREEMNLERQRQGCDKLRRRLERRERDHPRRGGVDEPRRAPAIAEGKDETEQNLREQQTQDDPVYGRGDGANLGGDESADEQNPRADQRHDAQNFPGDLRKVKQFGRSMQRRHDLGDGETHNMNDRCRQDAVMPERRAPKLQVIFEEL